MYTSQISAEGDAHFCRKSKVSERGAHFCRNLKSLKKGIPLCRFLKKSKISAERRTSLQKP
jgi:hypothetical protein